MPKLNQGQFGPPPSLPVVVTSERLVKAKDGDGWLVENVLAQNQPAVIAGPSNTLKSSLAINLAVSLSTTCASLLGAFCVPVRRRVAVLTGGIRTATLQEYQAQSCNYFDVDPMTRDILWMPQLPRLDNSEVRDMLRRLLREKGVEVVILDPVSQLFGGGGGSSRSLQEMGDLLRWAGDACLEGGATPVFVHNATGKAPTTKNAGTPRPFTLDDLRSEGITDYVPQWILLNRRSRFQEEIGRHELSLEVGGTANLSGRWDVDIEVGAAIEDPGVRTWEVQVSPATLEPNSSGTAKTPKGKTASTPTKKRKPSLGAGGSAGRSGRPDDDIDDVDWDPDDDIDDDDDDEPVGPARKARKKPVVVEDDEDDAPAPPKKGRKPVIVDDDDDDDDDWYPEEGKRNKKVPPTTRGRGSSGTAKTPRGKTASTPTKKRIVGS